VIRLGDPLVSAAQHIFLGEMEAKRGLLHSARRHTNLGLRLLSPLSNLWLESLAENNYAAIAIMSSDLSEALNHAERARALSEQSGAAAMLRASVGNLGTIYHLMGEFDRATEYLQLAVSLSPSAGEFSNAALDALARNYLVQGRLDQANEYVDKVEIAIASPNDRVLYPNRYSLLTAAELLMKRSEWKSSLEKIEELDGLCDKAGDQLLRIIARLRKVEVLRHEGETSRAASLLFETSLSPGTHPPDIHAHYERILGSLVGGEGDSTSADRHFDRAERLFRGLKSAPGLIEVAESRMRITQLESNSRECLADSTHAIQAVLQDAATLMMHAGRPELLATEIVAMLAHTGCVEGAVAIARDNANSVEKLAAHGSLGDNSDVRTFPVGMARHRSIEVLVRPTDGLESLATLNAVAILLGAIQDLDRAHAEREERLALWPSDELPTDNDDAVILGQLRKVMTVARRIARTKVVVLITGESGTGKEVVARAVHKYSNRAHKPFVPFNCTAVPRELLESQLFGYRRGAFTGADRDNQGLIRTAQDGTLFFDEIGELGLDLQPKLLRFLESGEINPLGEMAPINVDVRIIAATNANLEQLVQAGRFREDLYYRLNVIRLTIDPLRERRDEIPTLVHHFVARAASEYGKGHLRVAEETMEHLVLYSWPGNVRQLQNELRRMVALADPDSVLLPVALSESILRATPRAARTVNGLEIVVPLTEKLIPTLTKIEGEMIRVALRTSQGRVEAAARALGISRKGLYLKRQRLGL
jgi:DNA-binding NtrC family response regulator/tetratricopeptide (TPR) repeat protein